MLYLTGKDETMTMFAVSGGSEEVSGGLKPGLRNCIRYNLHRIEKTSISYTATLSLIAAAELMARI